MVEKEGKSLKSPEAEKPALRFPTGRSLPTAGPPAQSLLPTLPCSDCLGPGCVLRAQHSDLCSGRRTRLFPSFGILPVEVKRPLPQFSPFLLPSSIFLRTHPFHGVPSLAAVPLLTLPHIKGLISPSINCVLIQSWLGWREGSKSSWVIMP